MDSSKQIIFILVFLLCSFPVIAKETSTIQTFKQDQSVNYSFRCYDNLTAGYCSSTTLLLLNVEYPDGTNAVDNATMIYNGSSFKYVLPTDKIGENYRVLIHSPSANNTLTQFSYHVTPSGFSGTLGFYVLILLISGSVIFLGYYSQDYINVIFGSLGLYFIGFFVLFYGVDGIKDPVYTWAIAVISLGVAFYLSVRASYEAFF